MINGAGAEISNIAASAAAVAEDEEENREDNTRGNDNPHVRDVSKDELVFMEPDQQVINIKLLINLGIPLLVVVFGCGCLFSILDTDKEVNKALAESNSIALVVPNQEESLPDASASSLLDHAETIHVVVTGETMFSIARDHNLSLTQLLSMNGDNIPDPNIIWPGDQVIIALKDPISLLDAEIQLIEGHGGVLTLLNLIGSLDETVGAENLIRMLANALLESNLSNEQKVEILDEIARRGDIDFIFDMVDFFYSAVAVEIPEDQISNLWLTLPSY